LNPHETLAATFALIEDLLATQEAGDVQPPLPPERAAALLPIGLSNRGAPADEVWRRIRLIAEATPRTTGPRFWNQLFAGRDATALGAEMVAAALNTSMYTYKVAGPMALIERELARHMGRLAGFPDAEGVIAPGGSLANLVPMLLARNLVEPDGRERGLSGRRLLVYASEVAHYSIRKNAGILGIGRQNVRPVPADTLGRMLPDVLDRMIREDVAQGGVPVLVVATAGTTVLGTFDPLDAIADVTEAHHVWFHVDGALGGTLLLHPQKRARLAGLHRANSFVWNAHKMMGIPLTCSMVLVRDRGALFSNLAEVADYLFQADDDALDMGQRSLQCGRRNDALKLWAAWQVHGDEGWAARIQRQLDLAERAVARIHQEPGLALVGEADTVTVCFTVDGVDPKRLSEALYERGLHWVSWASALGHRVVRLVTLNPDLQEHDVDRFFDELVQTAARLRGQADAEG
jgi:sulfinoalanine decarboxylase/sulfinoalanine decarboxylase/aspartate 1-decarboxylase